MVYIWYIYIRYPYRNSTKVTAVAVPQYTVTSIAVLLQWKCTVYSLQALAEWLVADHVDTPSVGEACMTRHQQPVSQ